MRYLCLVYGDGRDLPKAEGDALTDDALSYDDELRAGGHYLVSAALQPVQTATTLRIRNGKVTATDGPFAETKEQLGGFILIEARDLDEAIRLASGIPPLRTGSIEVRPVRELTRSNDRRRA